MPTADDIDNQINDGDEEQVNEPAPAPAPATPSFDASAIGREIVTGLREYAMENEARQAARNNQPAAPAPEQELVIGDDDTPAVIAMKAAHNAGIPLRKQMAEMQRQFQTVGMGTLANVSRRQVLDNDPVYKKYKTEVDSEISRLDAVAQANPDVLATVRDVVRARHVDDEVRERAQALVQAALKSGEGATPGSASGRNLGTRKTDVPTPEELGFDEDQINMIERRGGPDMFASKISQGRYENWEQYAKAELKARAAKKANKTGYKGFQMSFTRAGQRPKA